MTEKIQELLDTLFRESDKAGIPIEEIQKGIASRLAEKKRKEAFRQRAEKFAEKLTGYGSRECDKRRQIQQTVDVLCIYHELSNSAPSKLAEECSRKWKCTIPAATGRIYNIMCRLKDWNSACKNPLALSNLYMNGRGSTDYVFGQTVKYILSEEGSDKN